MVNPVLVTTILSLSALDNNVLAAAYNGLFSFGKISQQNLAFDPMLKAFLIREDGRAHDHEILLHALSHSVNERIAAGTFN